MKALALLLSLWVPGLQAAIPACIEYQIVEGTEEVFGSPEADRQKAYVTWKEACERWKLDLREMNKDNQILAAGCARPSLDRQDNLWVYRGTGLYKLKTRIRDAAPPPPSK